MQRPMLRLRKKITHTLVTYGSAHENPPQSHEHLENFIRPKFQNRTRI